jgi:hypothetical protein
MNKYFISYIATYGKQGHMAAGNTIIETNEKIRTKEQIRRIELIITKTKNLTNAAVMGFQEITE